MSKKPVRVAFPVGIGDCHWVMMKMRALSRFFDDRPIHGYINSGPDHATIGYLKMSPQIELGIEDDNAPYGYDFKPTLDFANKTDPVDAGSRNHRHWAKLENCLNYNGYDVWAVFNPCIDAGLASHEIWPELEPYGGSEYELDLNIPTDAQRYVKQFGERPLLLYPSGVSANSGFHANTWTQRDWAHTALELQRATGKRVVIVGSKSVNDTKYWSELRLVLDHLRVDYVDALGKTTIPQYVALINASSAWVGLNSGGGIVSAMLKVPTVMLWSDSAYPIPNSNAKNMHTNMQRSWLNERQQRDYRTLSFGSPELTPENVARKTLEVLR